MASPLVVYSGSDDGSCQNYHATYATARSGGGSWSTNSTNVSHNAGQNLAAGPVYWLPELFFKFDTSTVPAEATVTGVEFALNLAETYHAQHEVLQARIYDWTSPLDTPSFRTGDQFDALPILATFNYNNISDWSTYYAFTSEAGAPALITKAGTTSIILASDLFAAGTAPTGDARTKWFQNEQGVGYQPRLTVTYTTGTAPTVTTTAITDITATTATGGGTITDDGGAEVTAYGVCWNTTGTPTTADSHTHDEP